MNISEDETTVTVKLNISLRKCLNVHKVKVAIMLHGGFLPQHNFRLDCSYLQFYSKYKEISQK